MTKVNECVIITPAREDEVIKAGMLRIQISKDRPDGNEPETVGCEVSNFLIAHLSVRALSMIRDSLNQYLALDE